MISFKEKDINIELKKFDWCLTPTAYFKKKFDLFIGLSQEHMNIFGNLFVLEAANNHCGDIDRGLKLIRDHAQW